MTNAEKYKDEIFKIIEEDDDFAVRKVNGKLDFFNCKPGVACQKCIFEDAYLICGVVKIKWLYSKYNEPIKLTQDEYDFCRLIGHGYLVRFKDFTIGWYEEKPTKNRGYWEQAADFNVSEKFNLLKDNFPFISTEDIKPYSVSDMLQNCIIIAE